MQTKIRILLADDHELFRDGFAKLMASNTEIELLDMASNGEMLLAMVEKYRPDVVLTDVQMEPVSGYEVTREIVKRYPGLPVIAFSSFLDEKTILGMLRAGACGYLTKNARKEATAEAIKAAWRGETYYCETASRQVCALMARGEFSPTKHTENEFSPIEIRIIQLLCQDHSSAEIGELLKISPGSVNRYRAGILEKAGVRGPAALVFFAVKRGLISCA